MATTRARLARATLSGLVLGGTLLATVPAPVAAATCIETGAIDRDGTPLTARLVNPATAVTGRIDATGCDVGVYFGRGHGSVVGAEVFGARYYGVLVDGNVADVSVDVTNSSLHDIGEVPRTSVRHGQGVAYRSFDGGSASGTVSGNRVWDFQEAGINMTGPGSIVTARGNRVIGPGPQTVIEQNGIQVIFGAHGTVRGNVISDMAFSGTGQAPSAGILVAGGPGYNKPYVFGAVLVDNVITGSDMGIAVNEIEVNNRPSPTPNANVIRGNTIRNDRLNNVAGWGQKGYQAGINDHANGDRILDNTISGAGYDRSFCDGAAICTPIDVKHAIDPIVSGNVLG